MSYHVPRYTGRQEGALSQDPPDREDALVDLQREAEAAHGQRAGG